MTDARAAVSVWIDSVRDGDVLRFRNGALRTALEVTRKKSGRVHCICFAIKRCSWTKRGYTLLFRSDLLDRLECKTKARINIERSEVAQRILADSRLRGGARLISCCEVIGVFE